MIWIIGLLGRFRFIWVGSGSNREGGRENVRKKERGTLGGGGSGQGWAATAPVVEVGRLADDDEGRERKKE